MFSYTRKEKAAEMRRCAESIVDLTDEEMSKVEDEFEDIDDLTDEELTKIMGRDGKIVGWHGNIVGEFAFENGRLTLICELDPVKFENEHVGKYRYGKKEGAL